MLQCVPVYTLFMDNSGHKYLDTSGIYAQKESTNKSIQFFKLISCICARNHYDKWATICKPQG